MEFFFQFVIIFQQPFGCQCLNPSNTCCDTCLGKNLEGGNDASIGHMRAAAEFDGKVSHAYHTDDAAVFLSEKRCRTSLFRLLDGHILNLNVQAVHDLLIDDCFHLL